HDHGQDRLRPLPDLAGARDQRDFPEIVELDDGPAPVRAVHARAAAYVEHARVADAAPPAGTGRPGDGQLDVASDRVEAFGERAAGNPQALRRHVSRAVRVAAPDLEAV